MLLLWPPHALFPCTATRKNIAQCLRARTDYIKNSDKTNDGVLVSTFACDPRTVNTELLLVKKEYKMRTVRSQDRDVIACQPT
jgi:hypothetical protein